MPDADTRPGGAAPRQLRHKQLREHKNDSGREHKDGEYHAADRPVHRHGCTRIAAVSRQPVRDQELLKHRKPRPQICTQRQRHAEPAQAAAEL